eukprot:Nitzschia sp. Nitz4//NODE_293_length_29386_cov_71.949235//5393//6391//NITZ4_additional_000032-RA//-1//CDS//3329531818//5345//frame0
MGGKRLPERPPTAAGDTEGRKKKKGKKSKQNKESTASSDPTHKSSLESTTTAEGQILAQVCSTFNRSEQSRFEAFRRSALPAGPVSKYVAHCLIHEYEGMKNPERRRAPRLSELCAPGQAEEISIVVTTLAKSYAQRLVAAARALSKEPDSTPIDSKHILAAFQQRQAKGLDPGFFLQPASKSTNLRVLDDTHGQKWLAALQAQEDYDKWQEEEAQKATKSKSSSNNNAGDGGDSSSSGEEDFMDMSDFLPSNVEKASDKKGSS